MHMNCHYEVVRDMWCVLRNGLIGWKQTTVLLVSLCSVSNQFNECTILIYEWIDKKSTEKFFSFWKLTQIILYIKKMTIFKMAINDDLADIAKTLSTTTLSETLKETIAKTEVNQHRKHANQIYQKEFRANRITAKKRKQGKKQFSLFLSLREYKSIPKF